MDNKTNQNKSSKSDRAEFANELNADLSKKDKSNKHKSKC